MVKRCGTSNMLHSKSKNATSPQLPIALQCLCHNSVLWRLFLHIWSKSYKWIFIQWIRLTLSSLIVTAVTAHAEILQVKKEWQMCIVEWFWSLGKATWMEMGLSLDRKWCDYSFLFKFESSMKCFYIRRFFYSTWLSFHLSLDFFFSKGWGLIASLEHIRPQPLQTWCLIWSKIILIINLDSPLWLCIGSNQINRIHESSLMWICNTSTYLLQLVHLCCCNSKWWAPWSN